jgi:predicted nucleic acid-binding protein
VRITADTNVLVRAAVLDDPAQGAIAAEALLQAETVAVTLPSLCEFVWVLTRAYKRSVAEVAAAVRARWSKARAFSSIGRPLRPAYLCWRAAAISPTASSLSRAGEQEGASLRLSMKRRRR